MLLADDENEAFFKNVTCMSKTEDYLLIISYWEAISKI